MILPDANLLIYAIDDASPRHRAANQWLTSALSGQEAIGFAWTVLLAVMRIATNPAIFDRALTIDEVLEPIERWTQAPVATSVEPTQRHLAVMRGLLAPFGTAGNLVSDAHLAALAIEHGGRVASADHDFGRFPGLRWFDPLA
jgi:toxin-antitoxin system PIN domain toxin